MAVDESKTPHVSEAPSRSDLEAWIREATASQRRGDLARADRLYRRVLRYEPEHCVTLNNLGLLRKAEADLGGAERCFRAAIDARADLAPPYVNLASVLIRRGRLSAAAAALGYARSLEPGNATSHRQLGRVWATENQDLAAEAALRNALTLAPDDVRTHKLLASIEQDPIKALAWLRPGIEREPDNLELRERAGALCLEAARNADAVEHFGRAADLADTAYVQALYRGLAALALGDEDAADLAFASAHDIDPAYHASDYRTSLGSMSRFSRAFCDTIRRTGRLDRMASVKTLQSAGAAEPQALLVAVDGAYLDRYLPVILRNVAAAKTSVVHLHVMDPPDEAVFESFRALANLTVTVEYCRMIEAPPPQRMAYYSTARFVRACQFLEPGGYAAIALIDADSVWTDRIDDAFSLLGGAPVGLTHYRGGWPWLTYNASFTIFTNRLESVSYLRTVAAYAAHFLLSGRATWRLDQCALYSALYFHAHYYGAPVRYANLAGRYRHCLSFFKKAADEGSLIASLEALASAEPAMVEQFSRIFLRMGKVDMAEELLRQRLALSRRTAL